MKKIIFSITVWGVLVASLSAQTWTPPIGIPAPEFGIVENYRMYDLAINRNPALTYRQNAEGGFYTHYVNYGTGSDPSNPCGTEASPRRTIPGTLPEGAVVELHGDYAYSGFGNYFLVVSQGTVSRPVFIRGLDQATRPFIRYTLNGEGSYLIVENILFTAGIDFATSPHHMAVRHCEFRDMQRGVILISGPAGNPTHHIVIWNNNIHNADDRWDLGTADLDQCGFLANRYCHNIWVLDNHIHHNAGAAFGAGQYVEGFMNVANQWVHHLYIGRNIAHHNRQASFGLKCSTHVVFSQNVSYANGLSQQPGNIGAGFISQYAPEYVWMIANTVYDSQAGIVIGSGSGGVGQYHYNIGNLIYNIAMPDTGFESGAGISNRGAPRIYNIHNTIRNAMKGIKNCGVSANNIVTDLTSDEYIFSDTSADVLLTHNIFYRSSGPERIRIGVNFGQGFTGTIAQMEAALPAQAYGNQTAEPLFVDAANGDFHLQAGSPARDAGTLSDVYQTFQDLYGLDIRRDLAGIPRPQGSAWDIGAYEYVFGGVWLTITSPNGGELWLKGHQRSISWTASGVTGNLTIELLQNSSVVGVITSSVPASAGSFSWTAGQMENGNFITGSNLKIRISTAAGAVLAEKEFH